MTVWEPERSRSIGTLVFAMGCVLATVCTVLFLRGPDRAEAGLRLGSENTAAPQDDREVTALAATLRQALQGSSGSSVDEERVSTGVPEATTESWVTGRVVDLEREPVPGAIVACVLERPRQGAGTVGDSVELLRGFKSMDRSGGQGEFRLARESRMAWVFVSHADFVSRWIGPLTLRESEDLVIELRPGKRLEGFVVAEGGGPVPEASVLLWQRRMVADQAIDPAYIGHDEAEIWTLARLTTKDDGSFRSPPLEAGVVNVSVLAPTGASCDESGVTVDGTPREYTVMRKPLIRGRILEASTALPVAGAKVSLRGLPGRTVMSDAQGLFEIQASLEGTPELEIDSPLHLVSRIQLGADERDVSIQLQPRPILVAQVDPVPGLESGESSVDSELRFHFDFGNSSTAVVTEFELLEDGYYRLLAPQVASPATVHVEASGGWVSHSAQAVLKPGEDSGRVHFTWRDDIRVQGRVFNQAGEVQPGTRICAYLLNPAHVATDLQLRPHEETESAEDGSYQLRLEEQGQKWVLRFSHPVAGAQVVQFETTQASLGVQRVDVRLDAPRTVRGFVRNEDGRPLAGVEVVRADSLGIETTRSDEKGRYSFVDVPQLMQVVAAECEGFAPAFHGRFMPEADTVIHLVLEQGGSLRGNLVSGATGLPIRDFSIGVFRVEQGDDLLSQALSLVEIPFSSELGEFEFGPLRRGSYLLRVRAPNYRSFEGGPYFVDGGESPVFLTLQPGRSFAGKIEGVDGKGIEGVEVIVQRAVDDSSPFSRAEASRDGMSIRNIAVRKTDSRGRFRVTGLEDGQFVLQLRHQDHVPSMGEFELLGEDVEDYGQVLLRALTMRGTAWYPDGRPAAGGTVFVHSHSEAAGVVFSSTEIEHDGSFELGGLEPGAAYRVIANVYDSASDAFTVGSRQLELGSEDLEGVTILLDGLQPVVQAMPGSSR